jgi:hypothetical protein
MLTARIVGSGGLNAVDKRGAKLREAQAVRVSSLRLSTRNKLFRHLLIGRDYIHSHCTESASLASVARAACLSVFHLNCTFAESKVLRYPRKPKSDTAKFCKFGKTLGIAAAVTPNHFAIVAPY